MSNIIDFKTGKKIAGAGGETLDAPKETQTDRRALNLIKREVYEAIGAAIPNIDKDYNFMTFIQEGQIFESDAIEEGGFLTKQDIEMCYALAITYAPYVDTFAMTLKQGLGSL